MRRRSKVLIALAALAVVVVGLIGIRVASAGNRAHDYGMDQANGGPQRRAAFAEDVGKKLGVSGDKVMSATRAVFFERVDQAVKDGKITREQADRIRNRFDHGDFGRCGPQGRLRHHLQGAPREADREPDMEQAA
jgi:hypothetical protein